MVAHLMQYYVDTFVNIYSLIFASYIDLERSLHAIYFCEISI